MSKGPRGLTVSSIGAGYRSTPTGLVDHHKIMFVAQTLTMSTPSFVISSPIPIDGTEHIIFKHPDKSLRKADDTLQKDW